MNGSDSPAGNDSRWKQRFQNFRSAFELLKDAVEQEGLTRLEEEGLIQRFEYTFELAWKTLKDYQTEKGVFVSYPRDAIKSAFQAGLVSDGEAWMRMLESRNLVAHSYNQERFLMALEAVRKEFFPAISELVARLEADL